MNKKDVAAISIATAFNKKWWDGHRSSKVKGTGTGAQLDAWRKACPDAVGGMTLGALDKAEAACDLLEKSLKAAQAKCGDKEADDLAGIKKMLAQLDGYQTQLANQRKALTNADAGVANAIGDICKAIKDQNAELEKIGSEAKDLRERVANYEQRAARNLMEAAKKQLLEVVRADTKFAKDLELRCNAATDSVKRAEQPHVKDIAAARVNARLLKAVENYDTQRTEHGKNFQKVVDIVQNCVIDLLAVEKKFAGADTADKVIKSLEAQLTAIEYAPGADRYAGIMDMVKRHAGDLIKAAQKPEQISPDDWQKFAEVADEFQVEFGQVSDTDNTLARGLKSVTKTAEPFKGVLLVDQQVEAAKRLVAKRAKERADMMKVAPVFQKQLKDLLSKMPERVA